MLWFRKRYRFEDIFVLFIYTEAGKNYRLETFKFTTTRNLKGKIFGSSDKVTCLDGSSYPMSTYAHIAALDGKSLVSLLDKKEDLKKRLTVAELLRIEKELNEAYFTKKVKNDSEGDVNIDIGELF